MNVDLILQSDAIKGVSLLPDKSINLVITSPPYFQQRKYMDGDAEWGQEDTIEDYLARLISLFKECVRVTKDDGSIIWNLGDKYINGSLSLIPFRFAVMACDQAEVKLVNEVTWIKVNPTPRQFDRRMVSSTEPFFHFTRTSKYKYDMDSIRERVDTTEANPNTQIGQKYFKVIDESELSEAEKQHAKVELVRAINEVKAGELPGFRMKIRGIHALAFGGQEGGRNDQILNNGFTVIRLRGKQVVRDVFESPVETIRGMKHPAIYPQGLIEKFLKITTDENDIVLDPFMGSGTTALACKSLNRRYIGFELCDEFVKLANERLSDE